MSGVNSVVSFFEEWKAKHNYLWHDDPKRFIRGFLDTESNLMSEDFAPVEQVWENASEQEVAQAKALFKSLLEVIPARLPGELVYILSFLKDGEHGAHLTLLGPVLFPSEELCFKFLGEVRELSENTGKLQVKLTETDIFKSVSGKDVAVYRVEPTEPIRALHESLKERALALGGTLVVNEHASGGYSPHVSNSHELKLSIGDEFELGRIAFSVHPGAKLNISASEVKGNFRLRD